MVGVPRLSWLGCPDFLTARSHVLSCIEADFSFFLQELRTVTESKEPETESLPPNQSTPLTPGRHPGCPEK